MKLNFAFAVFLTAGLLMLSGCSNESADKKSENNKESTAEVNNADGSKLVFASSLWSQPSQREYIKNHIVKDFIKESGIPVKFEYVDGEVALKRAYLQKEIGQINMDIVTIHSGKMPIWINKGFVKDLTPYVKDWKDINFFPLFNKSANRDGKAYFMPVVSDVYILLANKKALKYLPKGADVNKLTWEQFVQWSHNMRKGEGVGRNSSFCSPFQFIYLSVRCDRTFLWCKFP